MCVCVCHITHQNYWRCTSHQNYWRGRVWGPMNYLVYAGLSHPRYAKIPVVQDAKKRLAAASQKLLMGMWLKKHHTCTRTSTP